VRSFKNCRLAARRAIFPEHDLAVQPQHHAAAGYALRREEQDAREYGADSISTIAESTRGPMPGSEATNSPTTATIGDSATPI